MPHTDQRVNKPWSPSPDCTVQALPPGSHRLNKPRCLVDNPTSVVRRGQRLKSRLTWQSPPSRTPRVVPREWHAFHARWWPQGRGYCGRMAQYGRLPGIGAVGDASTTTPWVLRSDGTVRPTALKKPHYRRVAGAYDCAP